MTIVERAQALCQQWNLGPIIGAQIVQAIAAAVAEERERCAKIADRHRADAKTNSMYPAYGLNSQAMAAGNIAAAIRAGEGKTP